MLSKSKKQLKRVIAWMLTLCMVFGMVQFPMDASAAGEAAPTNVARNKTVGLYMGSTNSPATAQYYSQDRTVTMAVDGISNDLSGNYCDFGRQNSMLEADRVSMYLQVDLGKVYLLDHMKMWRYWGDSRTYDATVIEVSENSDFSGAKIIYNSDAANKHGLGAGTDAMYPESSSGHQFAVEAGTKAQYVRVYGYGVKNSGVTNHINELEVWGTEYTEPVPGTYTVTIPSGDGYQVVYDSSISLSVQEGGSFPFSIVVDTEHGYSFPSAVKANNVALTANEGLYTIENIKENQTITVEGVAKQKCNVTFPTNPVGYSVSVVNGTNPVDYDGLIGFKVELAQDYSLSTPIVKIKDGRTLSASGDGVYRVANIQSDIEILVDGVVRNPSAKEKKVYLSDVEWKSAVNSQGATGENQNPSKDAKHHNEGQTAEKMSLKVNGAQVVYDKGIGTQSDSSIVYDINGKGYHSFQAMAGVDYTAIRYIGNEGCDVQFKVYVDDIVAFDSGVMDASMEAKEINIPLTKDNKKLTLETKMVTEPYNDWGNWADACFMADYPEPENLALNKTAVVKKTAGNIDSEFNAERPPSMAVDGIKTDSTGNYSDFGADKNWDSRYLQIDLGASYELSQVNMWRYWLDGRTYKGTVIAASEKSDFSDYTVIYNSDTENKHGFGAGADALYPEVALGKSFMAAEGTTGRYVRVYMAGSDKGSTNHIVEVEVMGYNFNSEPAPYEANALENAKNYIDLPTNYDTTSHVGGQVTHPDVQVFDEPWNGYRYWMVYTPNVMLTSQHEQPSIVASNDGLSWEEPEGLTHNPIVAEPPSTRYHNNDADMVYDPVNDRLMAFWKWDDDQAGGVGAEIRVKISYDGLKWGKPLDKDGNIATTKETMVSMDDDPENGFITAVKSSNRYDMQSPTFTYDSYRGIFVMWAANAGDAGYGNGQKNFVEMSWSNDGLNWSARTKVKNFLGKNQFGQQLAPWHQDISYIPQLKEYWGLSQCFSGGTPDGSVLYLTKSKDGINWQQVGTKPILNAGKDGDWDDFQIYRSTFFYDATDAVNPEDGVFRVWYSALQKDTAGKMVVDSSGNKTIQATSVDTRIWRIGYTENNYLDVMKALTQNESYEEAALVPGTALTISIDKSSIEVGENASLSVGFVPENTSDQVVKFTSQDPKIATVDAMGKITGVSEGDVTIVAQTRDGISKEILVHIGELQKGKIRFEVSHENPLYLENYYWSDDAPSKNGMDANKNYDDENRIDSPVMLYNTVPESLKENTVMLLIAERSLNNTDAIKQWIKNNVELCNANKIPCAVQIANGETNTQTTIPLSFWNDLAKENEYLVGFNAAEMYNRFAGDNRDYVMDVIRVGITNGVSMMWTDTNIFDTNGVIYKWLTQDDKLANLMRDNKEYISMMTKESYGSRAANTDALFMGLWLTDYIGNWGIASDWWHWQLDDNGKLFTGGGSDPWKQCLTWPENMYTQDVVLAASQGATCFKSEAQWYSNATKGMRTPTYQYSLIPLLEKLVSQGVKIPTKAEVLERTKAVIVGESNWSSFNYDMSYSNLYPKTGQYGIVPYVPTGCPESSLDGFELVIRDKYTDAQLKTVLDGVYPVLKSEGTAFCENYGDTWYWMNSSENKNVNQYTSFTTAVNSSENVRIEGAPHVFGIIKEKPEALNIYLSNYRLDKTELWDGTFPGGFNDQGCYDYVWKMCDRMKKGTGLDTALRDTVITVKNAVEPKIELVTQSPADRNYSENLYVRPFTSKIEKKAGTTDEWVVTISHNGMVELNIITGDKDVAATSVKLSADKLDVIRNRTASVSAEVLPANAGNKQLIWTVKDSAIAKVDNKGVVTGLKEGKTTLRAAINDKVYAECEINVIDIKVTDVTVSKAAVTLDAGEAAQVSATVFPEDTSDASVTWSSSNEAVATVSANGTITAHQAGVAQVTAKSAYEAKAIVTVTVNYAASVKLDRSKMTAVANSEYSASGEGPAQNVLDSDMSTVWHTKYPDNGDVTKPHWIKITFGETKSVNRYAYTARTGAVNGTFKKYILLAVTPDGKETEVARGTFDWTDKTNLTRNIDFNTVEATALILKADGSDDSATVGGFGSAAEVNIYGAAAKPDADTVAGNIKVIAPVKASDTAVTLPALRGYEVTLTNTNKPEVIALNGSITRPVKDTEVTLTLTINDNVARKTATTTVKVLVTGSSSEVSPESVALNKSTMTLLVDGEETLTATVTPANATNKNVTWTSDKPAVATVVNGKVKAVAAGTANIKVTTVNGKTAVCVVTVKEKEPEEILPSKVSLNETTVQMAIGAEKTLNATVEPSNATNKNVTWTSDKPAVATVVNGKVKAVAAGTANIKVTTVNGKTAVCVVTVKEKEPEEILPIQITLDPTAALLMIGEETTLTATVKPENASNKTVSWASDNTAVATVVNGKVKAVAAGRANITATTVNGKTAVCVVTVKPDVPEEVLPTQVTLDKTVVKMEIGSKTVLTASVMPSGATNKTVTWYSSNNAVATVSNGTVTAVNAGTAVVKGTTINGKEASCTVTVEKRSLAKAAISAASAVKHTGKSITPSVKVSFSGTALRNGTDYTVSYKNNKNPGTASIILTGKGNYTGTVTKNFDIYAAKGKTYTVGSAKYTVTSQSLKSGTVTYKAPVKKTNKSVSIGNTVRIGKHTYKITAVGSSAFKNNTKLTKVTIGSNVKSIGSYAFYNTPKVKSITVKSRYLKSIGKKAFSKGSSKLTVKVPSSKLKSYKKLFTGKGVSSKVKYTKF